MAGGILRGSGVPWAGGTTQCRGQRGFCHLGSNLSHLGHCSETGVPAALPPPQLCVSTPSRAAHAHPPSWRAQASFTWETCFQFLYHLLSCLKKCHPSHSPGRPVSSCPRCSGPQTLPGRFSGLETAAQPGDCWGWVGARPRVGARAWPRDPTNTGSGVRTGLRTRGNVKEVPVQDPSCCLLGSPSEIFTPAFSHSGLSGGHLSPAGSGLPSLPPHRRTACVLTC